MQTPTPATNPQTRQPTTPPTTNFTYPSQNHPDVRFVHNVDIKGPITGTRPRTIEIQPNTNRFIVHSNPNDLQVTKQKEFPLNEVTFMHQNRQAQGKANELHVDTNQGKRYAIRGGDTHLIADQIQNSQVAYTINRHQFQEQPITLLPKKVDYVTPLLTNQFDKRPLPSNQVLFTLSYPLSTLPAQQQHIDHTKHLQQEDFTRFPRRKFYLNPEDWSIDKEKGAIVFINQEKKNNQKKVIGWIIKKFLTTGSFMGISYPTFVMKPESILESYAKALGAAPWLFDNVHNPVERMKKFVCLIHTFSLLFCDTTKSFNPPLGQTFQARIANGNFYAEQICHHPPISAFYYEGKGYRISGSLEMTASIGPNSAKGLFLGDLKVHFDDGVTYTGRMPCGQFSGFLFGQEKFQTFGTYYAYNSKGLICSMTNPQKRNFFQGYIGKLKPTYEQEFFQQARSLDRFTKFPLFQKYCFDTVLSFVQMNYSYQTAFDNKEYLNTFDEKCLPFQPQPINNQKLLLRSDSRFRRDIPLRQQLRFDQAQKEKELLEDEERYFRKLRVQYDPQHHQKS